MDSILACKSSVQGGLQHINLKHTSDASWFANDPDAFEDEVTFSIYKYPYKIHLSVREVKDWNSRKCQNTNTDPCNKKSLCCVLVTGVLIDINEEVVQIQSFQHIQHVGVVTGILHSLWLEWLPRRMQWTKANGTWKVMKWIGTAGIQLILEGRTSNHRQGHCCCGPVDQHLESGRYQKTVLLWQKTGYSEFLAVFGEARQDYSAVHTRKKWLLMCPGQRITKPLRFSTG